MAKNRTFQIGHEVKTERGALFAALEKSSAPKRLGSIKEVPVHLLIGAGILPALPPPTPEEWYGQNELQEALEEAMHILHPRHRRVLYGHYIEGKTLEELGAELRVSRGRVGQIEASALRQLGSRCPATKRLRKIIGL